MDNSIDRVCNIDLDGEYLRILEPNTIDYDYFKCQCGCYFFKDYGGYNDRYFMCLKCDVALTYRSNDIKVPSKVKTIII